MWTPGQTIWRVCGRLARPSEEYVDAWPDHLKSILMSGQSIWRVCGRLTRPSEEYPNVWPVHLKSMWTPDQTIWRVCGRLTRPSEEYPNVWPDHLKSILNAWPDHLKSSQHLRIFCFGRNFGILLFSQGFSKAFPLHHLYYIWLAHRRHQYNENEPTPDF